MRGLFWCQYLLGIGHLVRGLRLCQSLIQDFEIDFLQGGREVHQVLSSPRFHKIPLSPLSHLLNPAESYEEILKKRHDFLDSFLTLPYQFFVSQSFPMGKHDFTHEVLNIIARVKKINPTCLVVCSCLDYVPTDPKHIEWIYPLLDRYYDKVFIHCDPQILNLHETSVLAQKLGDKLVYTGYVSSGKLIRPSSERVKRILVTVGGGSVGEELLRAAAEVSIFFPDYEFMLVLGPQSSPKLANDLHLFQKIGGSNIRLVPFLPNFTEELQQCALSISLGGSTIIDLCETKTPGIIYPYPSKFSKQRQRAEQFASKGIVQVISPPDLAPHRFRTIIEKTLSSPFPPIEINLNGAENMRRGIQKLLKT
ncbi:glycosyltransferase [Parachlamydia sp. AcF125]|uniref:glycosyltransferase family protein n=1 Tax=Parachlamydia sp. AcF125 TaxID=2795736 RepID=UPI001BC8F775|nr:glycosyltransferase [Parachlamydia sp. AcF125]MBS4168195.1 UDP-N-acetylglucosamine--N-acetylmuramyl- (pentapeptide) pyrophosphoryl-undecaprenol N-acetylglucosamine transferase [Parachlamydia sp. AcF125]